MLLFDPSTIEKDDLDDIGVGLSLSSIVVHVKGTNSVVKTFSPLDKDHRAERRIYEHLQRDNSRPNIPNTLEGGRLNMSYCEVGWHLSTNLGELFWPRLIN